MSNSLEFDPVPAFELLQTLCLLDDSRREFEAMTDGEKQTFNKIMDLCRSRKNGQLASSAASSLVNQKLPRILVLKGISYTERISTCLGYLGYQRQLIDDSAEFGDYESPKLIIDW